jgi:hypothetical protein
MMEHDNYKHNPFTGISPHLAKHLQNEVYEELAELNEIQQMMYKLEGKTHRRIRKVQKHMMRCGECLSEQIKTGMLIELPDYWAMNENAGGGRYPKIHHQVN